MRSLQVSISDGIGDPPSENDACASGLNADPHLDQHMSEKADI